MTLTLDRVEKYSSKLPDDRTHKIIFGENNDVMDCLMPEYREGIKCIYIDPPYNNGERYAHYDDTVHDKWLTEITERLQKLEKLLASNGSIWISIDDGEMHYLKVAADNIFGRNNFVTTIVWQQRTTRENRKMFSNNHEYILVYAKNKKVFSKSVNRLPPSQEMIERYKNPDNDDRGPWQSVSLNVQAGHAVKSQFYEIIGPTGLKYSPPNGRCWAYNESKVNQLMAEGRIWFGKEGNGVPRLKKFLSETVLSMTPQTLWLGDDVGTNKEAKKHLIQIFPELSVFDTPKPERLIQRIFEIATNENDIVLDAYLGAGASVAVAHKMKRQYIGIDKGEHIFDYALQRQSMVLKGIDKGVCSRKCDDAEGFEFFMLNKTQNGK